VNEQDAALIAALAHLTHPFDRKQIGKLPKTDKRPELDYVNHAHVTNRLNQYAPGWSYTLDEMFTQAGECWVRGTMTIYGASRVEFGKGKNPLEAMSHFIRRAAMRFGVATDLWAKEDFEEDTDAGREGPHPSQGGSLPASTNSPAGGMGEAIPAGEPQLATQDQWANLLAMTSGKTAAAVQLLNEKNGTHYTYRTAKEGATWAELAAVLP
jgi:hypothetical protein